MKINESATSALPDSRGINLYQADPGFDSLLQLYLDAPLYRHLQPHLVRMGELAGGVLDELAGAADRNPPQLHHRTRTGADMQWIEKHPAYRRLEEIVYGEFGLAAMSHRGGVLGWPDPMPPIVKYVLTYVFVQAEFGVCCPLSMTDSLTRALRKFGDPQLVGRYLPGLLSQDLDTLTQGAMFMTEQGAGSDVGASVTRAVHEDGEWRLYGDKWFCSNADAGLALVLARPDDAPAGTRGLSLFLLPRQLPDGSLNRYRIVRLKDKLGTRGMASGEITLDGALAYMVGEPQRGFVQMADMINNSRLSNGMRAAGLMRRALTEALFVARRREAFGGPLIDKPLMQRQLMKLMVTAEAARSMMLFTAIELAKADAGDDAARRRARVLTPLLKFRACRDARRVTGDAMEVRGGVGYIEEWPDARLLREAHLGSIWEGTSNIVALDVMRAVRKEGALDALLPVLVEALPDDAPATDLRNLLERSAGFAREVAARGESALARQAASALYYTIAAVLLHTEGARLAQHGDARRSVIAQLTVQHRLAARDPLRAIDLQLEAQVAQALLPETPLEPKGAAMLVDALRAQCG